MQIRLILLLVVVTVVVIFAAQNSAMVGLKFFKFHIEQVPLYAVIVVSMLFGSLTVAFLQLMSYISLKLEIAKKDAEIKKLRGMIVQNEQEK